MARGSILQFVAAWSLLAGGMAIAAAREAPAGPSDLNAAAYDRTAGRLNLAEDAATRKQRKADCEAQAEKLFASQKKQFMKECMANKT